MFRRLFDAFLIGGAVTLGSIFVRKGQEIAECPFKKARIKRKVKNIKNAIVDKEEA